jgi:3-hydroxyacyl-[acyl-carrier-protein] dehydratase
MRFELVDRIVELVRGERIVTVKAVSLAEEYLADHFPTFPVLPGVLMLQAMVESASWLVRDALDFEPSVILMAQAKNVTYRSFVKPGNLLRVEVQCRRLARGESDFEGSGTCDGADVVKARFRLHHRYLAEESPSYAELDERIRRQARTAFGRLRTATEPVAT